MIKKKLPHKKKLRSIKKLDKDLDGVFSIYIRTKNIDQDGYGKCYTCHSFLPWRDSCPSRALQCGHYITRGHRATRWLEENCRPQCYRCNVPLKGNYQEFADRLLKEIGLERWDRLMEMKYEIRRWSRGELEDEIEKFRILIKGKERSWGKNS